MAINYLKITTFGEKDTNDLFEALCKKACDTDSNEAKLLCNDSLDPKSVIGYKASLSDCIALIGLYDLEFEFKVNYVARELSTKVHKFVKEEKLPISDTHTKMKEQSENITNPDLKDVKKNSLQAPKFSEGKNLTDLPKIPNFPG